MNHQKQISHPELEQLNAEAGWHVSRAPAPFLEIM